MSPDTIRSWHVHVYFDAARRDLALKLRGAIQAELGERAPLGRFNEGPVGPHPIGSYEIDIRPADLGEVLAWLVLHRGPLDLLLHPNSDDELRDHREGALWLGRSYDLNLAGLA